MEELYYKASVLRALSLISTSKAGSGHPTSCLSAADMTAVLFDKYFSFDLLNPNDIRNDRIIFSKGHAAPLLYSAFSLAGAYSRADLLKLRKYGNPFEGHPSSNFKYAPVATGSLGQGLSIGAGMALLSKKENIDNHIFVLMGDGEIAEGQVYEAVNFASYYKLDNLVGFVDVNKLGQTGPTMFDNANNYENIFFAHGANTIVIDGNNPFAVDKALSEAVGARNGKPTIIIANTIKGKGISFLEGKMGFHGKPLKEDELEKALLELKVDKSIISDNSILFNLKDISSRKIKEKKDHKSEKLPLFKVGEEIATRDSFGKAILNCDEIYVFDGDVGNSTSTNGFKEKYPDNFVECFIAEQNMVSSALGFACLGKVPLVSSFGAFLTRSFDQIRMANISKVGIKFNGSHAGVSVGEDGPSQMALEDIAMFTSIPGSVVIQPSDANSCIGLVDEFMKISGVGYFRTLRPKTKVIYEEANSFRIGGSKVLRSSDKDLLLVVATGICVEEALKAYEKLLELNINISIVDAYSIKPLDVLTINNCIEKIQKKIIITVEDHYIDGGLGSMVASELSGKVEIKRMAVREVPRSGSGEELMKILEIDSDAIVNEVRRHI